MNLIFFYQSGIPKAIILEIINSIKPIFKFNSVISKSITSLPQKCYYKDRDQYDASCLLDYRFSPNVSQYFRQKPSQHDTVKFLCVHEDIFAGNLNFVFGVARQGSSGIISTCRLEKDLNFYLKEVIHELGHIFGLQHCKMPCVMTFSNTVREARLKSLNFCASCQIKLEKKLKN